MQIYVADLVDEDTLNGVVFFLLLRFHNETPCQQGDERIKSKYPRKECAERREENFARDRHIIEVAN
jgi:hypothetical protein